MFDYKDHNRNAWNRLAKANDRLARPAKDADYEDSLAFVDGPGWLGNDIAGKKVLCLAAGGGRQGPLYATAGANVTVVDISDAMLSIDQEVCERKGLTVQIVQTSMDDLSMLADASFDIVIHPVSTCYIQNIAEVYAEVARVTRPDGLYVSQHKQPTSLQTSIDVNNESRYVLLHETGRSEPLPEYNRPNLVREQGTYEFIHSWQSLIGLMCQSGFVVEDLIEPDHADSEAKPGSFGHRSRFVSPYVRIKARRTSAKIATSKALWTPEES